MELFVRSTLTSQFDQISSSHIMYRRVSSGLAQQISTQRTKANKSIILDSANKLNETFTTHRRLSRPGGVFDASFDPASKHLHGDYPLRGRRHIFVKWKVFRTSALCVVIVTHDVQSVEANLSQCLTFDCGWMAWSARCWIFDRECVIAGH